MHSIASCDRAEEARPALELMLYGWSWCGHSYGLSVSRKVVWSRLSLLSCTWGIGSLSRTSKLGFGDGVSELRSGGADTGKAVFETALVLCSSAETASKEPTHIWAMRRMRSVSPKKSRTSLSM
ncbi:hypothetical protein ACFPRL_02265 [Pseudoclavibacter helvolus]